MEGELDEELRFHLEHQVEQELKEGLTREEAMRKARLAFGGLDQVKEACRRLRGISTLETTIRGKLSGPRIPRFDGAGFLVLELISATLRTVRGRRRPVRDLGN